MPLKKTVNKTLVNGSEAFIYTFDVSFSELTTPALSGKLVEFFPHKIDFVLPQIGGKIISIEKFPVEDGTRVEFGFGNVNVGTSVNFTLACSFGVGRVENDSFTNTAELYADDKFITSFTADTVNLNLEEDFRITKSADGVSKVKVGEEITYYIRIKNFKDSGVRIENIVIEDILPEELIPVTSFIPVGMDTSEDGYFDRTYDGLEGSFTGKTLNFTLPSYSGNEYTITFKAKVAENAIGGERIINNVTWTVDGEERPDSGFVVTVFEEKASLSHYKFVPRYGTIGDEIVYRIYANNTGTAEFDNFVITDPIPDEIDIKKISFYSSSSSIPSYSLYVETSDQENIYKTVAENLSGSSGVLDLAEFIPPNERVLSIRAIIPKLTTNYYSNYLYLLGTINDTAIPEQNITNTAYFTASSSLGKIDEKSTNSTIVNGKSILKIKKYITPEKSSYNPLDEIKIYLETDAINGMISSPVFADLLPLGLDYLPDKYYFIFYDAFEGKTYDSRKDNFPIEIPNAEIIKNFNETGRTLVRFSFPNFTLNYYNKLTAVFTAFVTINPPSEFENFGYLGNIGNNTEIFRDSYLDEYDLDGDGITDEYIAKSNAISGLILKVSSFSIKKFVKGDLSSEFSKDSISTQGGEILYNLQLTNNQEVPLKNIELIDILPHIGDTGVILNTIERGSEFAVYLNKIPTVEIVNIIGETVETPPIFKIEYSESYDPIRFSEEDSNTIGTGAWSEIPPSDFTKIASIKITSDSSVILNPYERVIVSLSAISPVDVDINAIAYNSFALKADQIIEGETKPLLPTEPNKVSIRIVSSRASSIGGFVFDDLNEDGIYNEDDTLINGVIVELYDEDKNLIKSTISANNSAGDKGFYVFSNLEKGNYFVKFISPDGRYLTIEESTEQNGSLADPSTGFTELISVDENESKKDIIAGFCTEKPPKSEKISAWKQFIIDGGFYISDCSKNIKTILSSRADAFITDFEVVKTPVTNANFEGIKSTGYKLILKGNLKIAVEYSSDNFENYSAIGEIPFCSYVVLPKNYKIGNSIETNIILEDVMIDASSNRCFNVKAVAFAYAKINCGIAKPKDI